jgi:hypothetical protein
MAIHGKINNEFPVRFDKRIILHAATPFTRIPQLMNIHFCRCLAVLTAVCSLSSCDEGSSGLQQRLIELEAQRDAQIQKVAELQTRLNSLGEKSPSTPVPTASAAAAEDTGGNSDRAALIAAANTVGSELAKEVQPSALETYGQTQFVGFKLKTADGSFTNVLVPFFSKGDGYWECGWSKAEIKAALQNKGASANTVPPSVVNTAPPPVQPTVTQTPPPTSMPTNTPTVYQPPTAPPPVVVSSKAPDVPDPEALKLQPGEKFVTLTDLDGNPQRAILKADGTLRVIFK